MFSENRSSLLLTKQLILLFIACVYNVHGQETKPNIILIMADDMGYETISGYGGRSYKTPNIDAMASKGILFKNALSQPLCTPSRIKIMTGQYNYRNYEYFGYLGSQERTFGNVLQDSGYSTCIAGKWQLNGLAYKDEIKDWDDSERPILFGFQDYCLWQLSQHARNGGRYANPLIEQNGKILARNQDDYGPDIFSDFILDFIDRKKDKPFFIYYPMVLVHDPFVPTPDSPEWNDEALRNKADTSYFADMMEYTDKIVGRINRKLEELDLSDNTIVIFTGDNGTHPTVYSKTRNGIVRGGKGKTTAAGTHVPLVITWGDKIKAASEYEGLVEFSDFYATFEALVKGETESDGVSLLDLLRGDSDFKGRETAFVHYNPKWGKNVNRFRNQFIQTIDFKLYQDGKFYNLKEDVLEKHPISEHTMTASQKVIRDQLQAELEMHPKWNDEG